MKIKTERFPVETNILSYQPLIEIFYVKCDEGFKTNLLGSSWDEVTKWRLEAKAAALLPTLRITSTAYAKTDHQKHTMWWTFKDKFRNNKKNQAKYLFYKVHKLISGFIWNTLVL